ncbi:MAG TPA: SEC59/DGK1/VTE5 family protein [Desulfobacterales bacterium]|nr:SEC59/DGK1/VTE5 family protein [Desulfobacterales bacterium]
MQHNTINSQPVVVTHDYIEKSRRSWTRQEHAAAWTLAPGRARGEVVRKALHLLIALVPALASLSVPFTLALLAFGTLFYALAETSRRHGHPVLVVSRLTQIASRAADRDRFVLGPITLGLGAMVSLMLYPEPAASLAIYALAFGDGFASLVGRLVPGPRIPFARGKSLMGSLACFTAVAVASLPLVRTPSQAVAVALTATVLEAFPSGDFDNLLVPVGTGLVAAALLGL